MQQLIPYPAGIRGPPARRPRHPVARAAGAAGAAVALGRGLYEMQSGLSGLKSLAKGVYDVARGIKDSNRKSRQGRKIPVEPERKQKRKSNIVRKSAAGMSYHSAPMARALTMSNRISTRGHKWVQLPRKREFIGSLLSASTANGARSTFSAQEFALSPSNTFFPWLSQIAPLFTMFRFKRFKLIIRNVNPTTMPGSLYVAYDGNAEANTPASKSAMLGYPLSKVTSAWDSMEFSVPKSWLSGISGGVRYTSPAGTQPDELLHAQGVIFLATEGVLNDTGATASIEVGEIFADYQLEVCQPRVAVPPGYLEHYGLGSDTLGAQHQGDSATGYLVTRAQGFASDSTSYNPPPTGGVAPQNWQLFPTALTPTWKESTVSDKFAYHFTTDRRYIPMHPGSSLVILMYDLGSTGQVLLGDTEFTVGANLAVLGAHVENCPAGRYVTHRLWVHAGVDSPLLDGPIEEAMTEGTALVDNSILIDTSVAWATYPRTTKVLVFTNVDSSLFPDAFYGIGPYVTVSVLDEKRRKVKSELGHELKECDAPQPPSTPTDDGVLVRKPHLALPASLEKPRLKRASRDA